jgi:hypothetical protein
MKKHHLLRLTFLSVAGILLLTTSLMAAASQAKKATKDLASLEIPAMVNLAMDSRQNLYTASRTTGNVFCIPPDSNPIKLAKILGTPTSVTVDKLRNVFVGTEEGVIFIISLDGTVSEAYHCKSSPIGLEMDRDGGLIIATKDGKIIKVNRKAFKGTQ